MPIHHAYTDQDLLWGLSDHRGDLRSRQIETAADQRLMWATAGDGEDAAAEARRLTAVGGELHFHHLEDYRLQPGAPAASTPADTRR